ETAPRKADGLPPFVRLGELLADIEPGKSPINLAVGEPQHAFPGFVGPVIAAHLAEFGRYPAGKGTERFRGAVAEWLTRRYRLERIDPERHLLLLSRTREGPLLPPPSAKPPGPP